MEIRIFFFEKNHNPPLQVKWSFPKESNIQKTNVTQQIFTLKIKETLGNISPTKKFCKQTETTIYQKLFCRALHWWSKAKRLLANNQTLFNKQG
jgi:hypothetical protein